ncbi:MAG: MFS transporter, partial [Proteobacteria bacterium]|nr:MFS transporter [Pseudomonadota bacterium]
IVIQLWSLAVYVVMAVLLLTDSIRLWHVYLTSFLLGGGMALNQPVRTSFIPQLLDGRLLINAISLNSVAINVARLAGPAAIGFLMSREAAIRSLEVLSSRARTCVMVSNSG